MPHLLCSGASVYNGNLRGPVTITLVPVRLPLKLFIHVITTWVCHGMQTPNLPLAGRTTYTVPTPRRIITLRFNGCKNGFVIVVKTVPNS